MRKLIFQVNRWLRGVQKVRQPVTVEVRRAEESARHDRVARSLLSADQGPRVKRVW